ncbi:Hypothetical protein SMAX5B_001419 [Scophthalmus maximus]|uniref:Uncharacterized protein n=1 Tax=Scophthalmus maximus TaxID=52904 RepID=A0A2U9B7A5_SCOMX|nr:Hypothetical protein SMAX5B_001419 [Scophthalmus maximus]
MRLRGREETSEDLSEAARRRLVVQQLHHSASPSWRSGGEKLGSEFLMEVVQAEGGRSAAQLNMEIYDKGLKKNLLLLNNSVEEKLRSPTQTHRG